MAQCRAGGGREAAEAMEAMRNKRRGVFLADRLEDLAADARRAWLNAMRNDTAQGLEMPRKASGTAQEHWEALAATERGSPAQMAARKDHWAARTDYVKARARAQEAWEIYNTLKAEADAAWEAWSRAYRGESE